MTNLRPLLLSALLTAGLLAGCGAQPDNTAAPAPDFSLKTRDGQTITLSEHKGRDGVVLVFFSTRCPPCMREAPQVVAFQKAATDRHVKVYAVNIGDAPEALDAFVREYGINYPILLDSDDAVHKQYNVTGIPTVIGIDTAGVVRYNEHHVPRDTDAFIKKLTAPLSQ